MPQQYVVFTPEQFRALDDKLTEISQGGGGGGGIADGSVTTKKLANLAVTSAKLGDSSVTTDKLAARAVTSTELAGHSVTTDKLTARAVTSTELADKAVTWEKIDPNAVAIISSVWLVAADSQTDQVLTQLGYEHGTLTPKQMATGEQYVNGTLRLCWISGTTLEAAPINFVGNLQTQAITLWAKGLHSTATGILGVDESWTITAN